MLRKFLFAFVLVFFFVGGLFAAEYKGKVKSVDADKGTLTVEIDGKEKVIKTNDKTKFLAGKDGKEELKAGLKAKVFEKAGANVTIKTDGEGDKEVATEVTVTR